MKLRYGYAIVSFCPDLTDATIASVPLAGLIIGECSGEQVAAVVSLQLADDAFQDDPIAAAILGNLPRLLRQHVDEARELSPEGPLAVEAILRRLQDALRNTLHVSCISEPLEREIANDAEFEGMALSKLLVDEIMKRLVDVLKDGTGAALLPRTERRRSETPLPHSTRAPDISSWRLKRPATMSAMLA